MKSTVTSKRRIGTTKVVAKKSPNKSVKSKTNDLTKRQYKLEKAKIKAKRAKSSAEVEKERIKAQTKIALGAQASTSVAGSVASGIGYVNTGSQTGSDQLINGGMTTEGGLGRDDAKPDPS